MPTRSTRPAPPATPRSPGGPGTRPRIIRAPAPAIARRDPAPRDPAPRAPRDPQAEFSTRPGHLLRAAREFGGNVVAPPSAPAAPAAPPATPRSPGGPGTRPRIIRAPAPAPATLDALDAPPSAPQYERANDSALALFISAQEAAGEDVTQLRTYRREDGKHWTLEYRPAVDDMIGLCSRLSAAQHLTMWDIDDGAQADVTAALRATQAEFRLPTITLFSSGKNGHWLALSPTARPLADVARAILHTQACGASVDLVWLGVSLARGDLVIRATPKGGREVTLVEALESEFPAEADMRNLAMTRYEAAI